MTRSGAANPPPLPRIKNSGPPARTPISEFDHRIEFEVNARLHKKRVTQGCESGLACGKLYCTARAAVIKSLLDRKKIPRDESIVPKESQRSFFASEFFCASMPDCPYSNEVCSRSTESASRAVSSQERLALIV